MPKLKRERRERTDDWQQVKQPTLWPEQEAYEMIQAIVLYGQTASQRAKETGANERTFDRKADRFVASGMASLISLATFRSADEDRRELPPPRGETSDRFPSSRQMRSHQDVPRAANYALATDFRYKYQAEKAFLVFSDTCLFVSDWSYSLAGRTIRRLASDRQHVGWDLIIQLSRNTPPAC